MRFLRVIPIALFCVFSAVFLGLAFGTNCAQLRKGTLYENGVFFYSVRIPPGLRMHGAGGAHGFYGTVDWRVPNTLTAFASYVDPFSPYSAEPDLDLMMRAEGVSRYSHVQKIAAPTGARGALYAEGNYRSDDLSNVPRQGYIYLVAIRATLGDSQVDYYLSLQVPSPDDKGRWLIQCMAESFRPLKYGVPRPKLGQP